MHCMGLFAFSVCLFANAKIWHVLAGSCVSVPGGGVLGLGKAQVSCLASHCVLGGLAINFTRFLQ